jgi:hypothetical protein
LVVIVGLVVLGVVLLNGRQEGASQPDSQTGSGLSSGAPTAAAPQPSAATQQPETSRPKPTPPVIEISAAQLYQEYKANEVQADTKYKGRWLYVSGMVGQIGKDITDDPFLRILVGRYEFESVYASFPKSATSELARLSKGDQISVMCRGKGMLIGSPVVDCGLEDAPPRPHRQSSAAERPAAAAPAAAGSAGASAQTEAAASSSPSLETTSFDCSKARSDAEHIICTDADLARSDVELAGLFGKAKAAATDQAAFKERTKQAWNDRERNCHDKDCLVRWFDAQKGALSRIAETGQVNPI